MLISFLIIFLLAVFSAPQWLFMIFIYINFAWMVILYVGRLHDIGHSGWWTIPAMIPSLLGLIALAVWPGKKESNAYGEVPPQSIHQLLHFWRT